LQVSTTQQQSKPSPAIVHFLWGCYSAFVPVLNCPDHQA
jgi:hypothetical protein